MFVLTTQLVDLHSMDGEEDPRRESKFLIRFIANRGHPAHVAVGMALGTPLALAVPRLEK